MLGLPGLPEMRQVWLELPYLLQVWYILTILAASLVNRAQLAASLAALFWQYQLGAFLAALFRRYQLGVFSAALFQQHCLTSTKVIKEPQVSHTKIMTTRVAGGLLLGYNPKRPARDSSPWPSLRSGLMAA